MQGMFERAGRDAATWNIGEITNWNTSKVTNMSSMFEYVATNESIFDLGDLSTKTVTLSNGYSYTAWDVSNVTSMGYMFDTAGYKWKNGIGVGGVTTWRIGDVSNWDTSNVTAMRRMFYLAGVHDKSFFLDLSSWKVPAVTNYSDFTALNDNQIIPPIWVN